MVAVETAAGHPTHPVNVDLVPGATFCHPQVASVGMTEEQAKETGRQIKVGKFKLGGAGASVVYDDRAGLVKIVGDPEYGEILGAHIVGNIACDMIGEFVDVIALEGGYPELERIIHPHPTMSEAVLDAARAVDGWAIHACAGACTGGATARPAKPGRRSSTTTSARPTRTWRRSGSAAYSPRRGRAAGVAADLIRARAEGNGSPAVVIRGGQARRLRGDRSARSERGLPEIRYPEAWPIDNYSLTRCARRSTQRNRGESSRSRSRLPPGVRGGAGHERSRQRAAARPPPASSTRTRSLKGIETKSVKDRLRAATEEALERGVEGIPTVAVGGAALLGRRSPRGGRGGRACAPGQPESRPVVSAPE